MKKIHYPRTTASQRKKLFEVWEETQDVRRASQKARVSIGTYYYWKPRFDEGGYEALEKSKQTGPKTGQRIPKEVQQKVINHKKEHPKWGRQRIADEIKKKNGWVPLVSPSSVERILERAGLLLVSEKGEKKEKKKG